MEYSTVKRLQLIYVVFYFILLLYLSQKHTQHTTHTKDAKKQILAMEMQRRNQRLPVRLKIPEINVDASIEYVGLTTKGEMAVPENTVDVGWFDFGPLPGERGSAVIAGHFDGENGAAGVFGSLYALKKGDKVYIVDNKGFTITFIVQESRTYTPGYADVVFKANDSAHLNLITCDGVWEGTKKTYSKRLVVFADILK